ncbi:MAG: NAD-dependent epimerase/dehydratase family protein [Parcubacteria group bacterium]|nr:NAD-dependent epimerase/dehydratase family protein [Parcubacteria group bacterium]
MKILVTGGAGFVGSHIVDLLVEQQNDVVILDDLSTGKEKYLNKSAKFYKADIRQADEVNEVFEKEKPELVIHTAAQVELRKSIDEPELDAAINIIGTINVLEACRKNKVKKIIYTSTGGARVGEPEYLPVDEKHPLNPCAPYGISKHTAEHYVWMYNKLYNIDYLIYCFGNVYGPRDDAKFGRVISVFIEKILKGDTPKIFGDGKQTRDFIYVLDLAKFIVKNIDKNPEHKLFHLAYGEQVSVNEIFESIKKLAGLEVEVEHIEAVPGEVRDIVLDTKLVQKELEWKPEYDIKMGIEETYKWYKDNLK